MSDIFALKDGGKTEEILTESVNREAIQAKTARVHIICSITS